MEEIIKKAGLTSYQLKCIAIVTMLVDHTGAILFPGEMLWRMAGRLSFPIFCFLLVEGFCHTHDVRLYLVRLGGFALISEIPYDIAFHGKILEFEGQNVFFTLFLGVVLMCMLRRCIEWPVKITAVLLVMWLAVSLRVDYSFKGIFLIAVFFLCRECLWAKLAGGAVWNFLWNGSIQGYGALAMIPVALYNGRQGRKMKYFFYAFYPVHLLVLFLISEVMMKQAG